MTTARTPHVVLIYGLLGLIPFLAPWLVPTVAPALTGFASRLLALYGALILSFLGGARWGLAVTVMRPSTLTVSLAMLPTLVGLGLLLLAADDRQTCQLGLAAALGVQWLWDVQSSTLPAWYPHLRTVLSAGAVAGLVVGAFTLT